MNNSNFEHDLSQEKVVAQFLDLHFYPFLTTDFYRFTEKDAQLQGKDVLFTLQNLHKIAVDEKAQTTYINQNLPTFAFEVSFFRNNQIRMGWLFDTSKVTNFYFLIWIKASKEKNIRVEDIQELDCLLIDRKDIHIFLATKNITVESIEEDIKYILNNKLTGKIKYKSDEEAYFYFTERLTEKPINIVIKKSILKKLAFRHFTITKEKVSIVSNVN
ncbi:MAG: hypothetical protein ACMXYF_03225 [Candidatus Woesearchaeota archaeon]